MSEIDSSEIVWETPPAREYRHRDFANALRARPGEWAVFQRSVHAGDYAKIKRGVPTAFQPAGTFEARAKSVGNGRFDIYVRFIGEDGTP